MTAFEYTQMYCDSWQMHHLANRWAGQYGWEVVSAVNVTIPDFKVPRTAGDEDGPEVVAVNPVAVLFRRPVGHTLPAEGANNTEER